MKKQPIAVEKLLEFCLSPNLFGSWFLLLKNVKGRINDL